MDDQAVSLRLFTDHLLLNMESDGRGNVELIRSVSGATAFANCCSCKDAARHIRTPADSDSGGAGRHSRWIRWILPSPKPPKLSSVGANTLDLRFALLGNAIATP